MTTSEKIEIRELYEFQLYEKDWLGRTKPVGPLRRSLDRRVHFDGEEYALKPSRRYAYKCRRIDIDTGGYGIAGKWSDFSSWQRPS